MSYASSHPGFVIPASNPSGIFPFLGRHPETAETMHNLAQLREKQGNNEEARALYTEALAIREQERIVHYSKIAETRMLLSTLLHTIGLHEDANQLEAAQSKLRTCDE